jgi:hypothetical protein
LRSHGQRPIVAVVPHHELPIGMKGLKLSEHVFALAEELDTDARDPIVCVRTTNRLADGNHAFGRIFWERRAFAVHDPTTCPATTTTIPVAARLDAIGRVGVKVDFCAVKHKYKAAILGRLIILRAVHVSALLDRECA